MTEFQVLYRGVPVPKSALVPVVFGGDQVLKAFKDGVNGAFDLFESLDTTGQFGDRDDPTSWVYYTDEADPNDPAAYFRRFRGEDSQFLGTVDETWRNSPETDEDYAREVGYHPVSFDVLPDRVKNAYDPSGD